MSRKYREFEKNFLRLKHRNIILYGLNETSKEILKNNDKFNILGLEYNEKQKVKNIKKIKIKNFLKYKPIIIITTKTESSKLIFLELKNLYKKKIEIFFFDGTNEIKIDNKKKLNSLIENVKKLKLKIDQFSSISFDIFDTLIFRKVNRPRDIYKILNIYAQKIINKNIRFDELRLKIQTDIEKKNVPASLYEIYNDIAKKIGINEFKKNAILKKEIEIEKEISCRNELIYSIFQYCKKKKKNIYLTSDTHFNKTILKEILSKNKIFGYKEIISSCDYKLSKETGKLYNILAEKENARNILHIGDNAYSDKINAKNKGISSYKIISKNEFIINTNLKGSFAINNNISDIISMGLFNKKIFEIASDKKNLINNSKKIKISAKNFGYIFIGSYLFEYFQLLNWLVKKKSIKNIFFCSREGFFLKKIYETFFKDKSINSVYFKTSRFLSYNVSFFTSRDILNSFKFHRYIGTFRDLLLNRFFIKKNKPDKNLLIKINSRTEPKLLKKLLLPYFNQILKNSQKWRSRYQKYIKRISIGKKILISDISLFATVQKSLEKISNCSFYGCYIPTQTNYKLSDNISYMKISNVFEKKYFILESILTAPHGSYLYLDNKMKFKLSTIMENQRKFSIRYNIIKGVHEYFKDFLKIISPVKTELYNKNSFTLSKDFLFQQLDNKIFLFEKKMLNALNFDNLFVRSDENKIIF